MNPGIFTLQDLDDRVKRVRQESWRPGTWGRLLSRESKWSAIIDDTSLRVSREIYLLHAVKAVRLGRGAIWARVLVEHEDGTSRPLGGLTGVAPFGGRVVI